MAKPIKSIISLLALLFSAAILAPEASALAASRYASSSRLSEGHWVKIKVDTTGVYRIPYDKLRQLGFSSPEKVFVYGTGATTAASHSFLASNPDDLPMTPCLHSNNSLIFYGEGDTRVMPTDNELGKSVSITRSYADHDSFFFLGESASGTGYDFQSHNYTGTADDAAAQDWSMGVSYIENERTNIGEGGAHMFDDPISAGNSRKYFLDIKDIYTNDEGNGSGYLTYSFVSDAYAKPDILPEGEWSISNKTVAFATSPASNQLVSYAAGKMIYTGHSESNWLTIDFKSPDQFAGDYYAPDYLYTVYKRRNRLGDNSWRVLNFAKIPAGTHFKVTDVPEDVEIWNVTDLFKTVRLDYKLSGTEAYSSTTSSVADGQSARYLVFSPSAELPEPTIVGEVANQNLHADKTAPQMLIISTSTLLEQAQALADIHRNHDGMDVKVVCQDLIFNEFSSGSRLPQGIRRYIKMLYDSDTRNKFKYVLLYGPAIYDNRFFIHEPGDYLPTYENETRSECLSNTTNYGCDIYYGTMADNYTHNNLYKAPTYLSVGRIPAFTTRQAADVNAKIAHYLSNPIPSAIALRALFLSDCNNEDNHYLHSQSARNIISTRTAPTITSFASHIAFKSGSPFPSSTTKATKRYLEEGTSLFWYAGHGAASCLGSTVFWNTSNVISTPYNYAPFGFFATCDAYGYDYISNVVGAMITSRRGGLIGGISSNRTVFMQYNSSLNDGMAQAYVNARPGDTFADVFYTARNTLIRNLEKATCINILAFNYCGDPSIKLPVVANTIEITDGNGQSFSAAHAPISPSQPLRVKGRIKGSNGSALSHSGTGSLQIFAPARTESYKGEKAASVQDFTYEDELLVEIPVTFENGLMDVSVNLPDITEESSDYRLVISMRDTDTEAIAAGLVKINMECAAGPDATQLPQFDSAYIDDPANTDGAVLTAALTAQADITAGTLPLVTSPRTWAGHPRCILDGSIDLSNTIALTPAGQNRYHLQAPLPQCASGRHWIEFSVSDAKGNTISRLIDFTIDGQRAEGTLALAENIHVYRNSVEIDAIDISDSSTIESLHIVDASGNVVYHVSNPSFPFTWNLKDYNGNHVADGEYEAYIRLRRHNTLGSSPKVSFMVLK